MSVKKEYEPKLIKTERDDMVSNEIHIKLEYPHQSVQFLAVQQNDKVNQLKVARDPLELSDDDNNHNEHTATNTQSLNLATASPPKKLKKLKPAICTKCNTGFPTTFLFEQHMIQIHQDERPYPCKHCGKPFATKPQQKAHETIHDPKRFQGEPQFKCDICGNSYHLKGSLQGHKLKAHTDYKPPDRPHTAPVKEHHSTSGSKNLNRHRKPKGVHKCPHCDLTFPIKSILQLHIIVHTKERPFFCPSCPQTFPRKDTLKSHMKSFHSTDSSSKAYSRLRSKDKQPCPCTICGKVYPSPSKLANHMLLHTGEKPISCKNCDKKFRRTGDLNTHMKQTHLKDQLRNNPLKLYKCRICGRNDFVRFTAFKQHRMRVHRHIPYDEEKEKPFACGICERPYYLREGALICAVLCHDPSRLRKMMFKVRCPECPEEEIFGFYSVLALRRHWNKVHENKQLPAKLRVGMYDDIGLKDELPFCTIDSVKRDDIKLKGLDSVFVKGKGPPLYIELELLEVKEEDRFFKRRKHKAVVENKEYVCEICGLKVSSIHILRRHVKVVHDPNMKNKSMVYKCGICGEKCENEGQLITHGIELHSNESLKRDDIGFRNGSTSVNIKDLKEVQTILNFQTVTVSVTRI